jgi:hypothetical protein
MASCEALLAELPMDAHPRGIAFNKKGEDWFDASRALDPTHILSVMVSGR